jgi:hypothetical protein
MWILLVLVGVANPFVSQTTFTTEISCVEASHKVKDSFDKNVPVKTVCVRQ